MLWKCILATAIVWAFSGEVVEGKRMLLRPIPAAKVREILKAAGREEALPEGRVISHGFAAINGFALGLKKGILGVALADSLASLSSTSTASNSTSSFSKPSFSYNSTSDQLCFTSRSSTSDIYASGEADETATPTTPTTPTLTTRAGTSPTTTNTATGTGTGTNTATNTATTTQSAAGTVNCIVLQKG